MRFRLFTWMTAIAMATSCTDEEGLGVEESELLGGASTSLRPEVGQFFHNLGTPPGVSSMCTATLIAPRVILTAAHCMESPDGTAQPTPVSVPTGARFVFTDAFGVRTTIPVDRVHSFGRDDAFVRPIPSVPMTHDVAIARLTFAVTPSQATPATIATREPTTNELSTWFGFGCTDRVFVGTGVGVKRVLTFGFNNSAVGCPGDSGGPQLFGGSPGSQIWGVATGYDFWGTDVFANVVLYKRQIEDQIRRWVGADEIGFDRFGFDYAATIQPSATACRSNCQNDPHCRAFTWRAADSMCWRKSAASEPTPGAGLVSGLPSRLEPGVDRLGFDYSAIAVGSAETCAAACGRDPSCKAWTNLGSSCWFKSPAPNASLGTCPGCTSGVVQRGLEPDVDRPGGTFSTSTTSTAFECQTRCNQNASCRAFTHLGTTCSLKSSVPGATVRTGVFATSGVKRGVESESDRPGGNLVTFQPVTLDPAECQASCASNGSCVAWTYKAVTPTTALCSIKNVLTPRVFSVDTVSGLKGLEMVP